MWNQPIIKKREKKEKRGRKEYKKEKEKTHVQ
jgi:hypothetical protein